MVIVFASLVLGNGDEYLRRNCSKFRFKQVVRFLFNFSLYDCLDLYLLDVYNVILNIEALPYCYVELKLKSCDCQGSYKLLLQLRRHFCVTFKKL